MKLVLPASVEKKLNAYVQSVDTEIAGMGKGRIDYENQEIIMEDVAIYDQEVTGGTADLSSLSVAKWATELLRSGGNPQEWFIWWHSHANMAAFFSGTDTNTIDNSTEYEYLVSLVVNRRRERKARLDTHRPFRLKMENMPIEIGTQDTDPRITIIEAKIRALVATKTSIETTVPDEIALEVAAKVKVRPFGGAGFGKHGNVGDQYEEHAYCSERLCYEALTDWKNSCLKNPALKKASATGTENGTGKTSSLGAGTEGANLLLPGAGGVDKEIEEIHAAIQNLAWEMQNCKDTHYDTTKTCEQCLEWVEEQSSMFDRLNTLFDSTYEGDEYEKEIHDAVVRALQNDKP